MKTDANDILRERGPEGVKLAFDAATDELVEPQADDLPRGRPQLRIDKSDLPETAYALRDLIAESSRFFDRGGPVLVTPSSNGTVPAIVRVTSDHLVMEAHRICRPVHSDTGASLTLPDRVARLVLNMHGEWGLPPLAGITTAPLLQADGSIYAHDGYDPETQLWCHGVPDVAPMVPMTPTPDDALAALHRLRATFHTFPFADGSRSYDDSLGVEVVIQDDPPGVDESAFLVALLTAVCRASLYLTPGLIVTAPAISGAGSGKGLLVRSTSAIAFGIQPHAFTTGSEHHELDKRMAAELVSGSPVVFLDNANGRTLKCPTLESAMTERPARIRTLGKTEMMDINSAAFIAATGNALRPSGDMARRFLLCEFDARCEDAEARPFKAGFLQGIAARRNVLLAAALTIWRWGRQNHDALVRGKPLGSYEQWTEWCRDPLVTLGCRDPVERISEAKARDPARQNWLAMFEVWWSAHQDQPVKAAELAPQVVQLIDPHNKGRQFIASELGKLVDTRLAGFVLTGNKGSGKWSVSTYALKRTSAASGTA